MAEGWIELDPAAPGDIEAVRRLIAELGAEWEVREKQSVGVDPTQATMLTVISVPVAVFVSRFLEAAAAHSYEALKGWLRQLSAQRRYTAIQVGDDEWRLTLPPRPTEEDFRKLIPPLSAQMIRRGIELQDKSDPASIHEAMTWFERAFDADDGRYALEAACRLAVLLRRRGDAESLGAADVWYQRACNVNTVDENRVAQFVAALTREEHT